MPTPPEPCNCGAEDCPRCRPHTYKASLNYRAWEAYYSDEMNFETYEAYVQKLNKEYEEEPWP